MPPRALPREVWEESILPHLKKPIPVPLSGVPPSDITQGDLASCMRLCKMFYPLCEKLLYTKIVTNAFPLLVRHVHQASMRVHLSLTTNLFIEYSPKGLEPTYMSLLRNGGNAWRHTGRSAKEIKKDILRGCGADIADMWKSLAWVRETPYMVRKVFPNLATIAVASIEGKMDRRWKEYDETYPDTRWSTQMAKGSFDQFLHELGTAGKLRHLCLRDAAAPMSTPSITMASHVPPIHYSRTIHIPPLVAESDVAFPFGAPIRWVIDRSYSTSWQVIRANIGETLTACIQLRKQDDGRPRAKSDIADLEIYGTSPISNAEPYDPDAYDLWIEQHPGEPVPDEYMIPAGTLSVEEQREEAKEDGELLSGIFSDSSGLKDKIRWFASADTPICAACQSGPPELLGGEGM